MSDPAHSIQLDFRGPYGLLDQNRSIFEPKLCNYPGIYLWTIKTRNQPGRLIHYIGESSNIAARHREHLVAILGFNYGIFEVEALAEGLLKPIWKGLWRDRTPNAARNAVSAWLEYREHVQPYIELIDIYCAELRVERALRKHVEGTIGFHLRCKRPEFKSLYPDDNRIGKSTARYHGEIIVASRDLICGLDEKIEL